MSVSDNDYNAAARRIMLDRLAQFEQAGGWDVANENAKHCTYHRYLEIGVEDCENAAKLIEMLIDATTLIKLRLQSEAQRLTERESSRNHFIKLSGEIAEKTKKIQRIYGACRANVDISDKQSSNCDSCREIRSSAASSSSVSNGETEQQVSGIDQNRISLEVEKKSAKALVEKTPRPATSLTGSFTIDWDDDTVMCPHPESARKLTFEDSAMCIDENTSKIVEKYDFLRNSVKKENTETVRILKPPELKSEIAKQLFREVVRKGF